MLSLSPPWLTLPFEITAIIVSFLPKTLQKILMESSLSPIAQAAQAAYLSEVEIRFVNESEPHQAFEPSLATQVTPEELGALTKRLGPFPIGLLRLLVSAIDEDAHRFLTATLIEMAPRVALISLKYATYFSVQLFSWECFPFAPSICERIRTLCIETNRVTVPLPPLPAGVRDLTLSISAVLGNVEEIILSVCFPPALTKLSLNCSWLLVEQYPLLPLGLAVLLLVNPGRLTAGAFNTFRLDNLKELRITAVDKESLQGPLTLPPVLESFCLMYGSLTSFHQPGLPSSLKELIIAECPLTDFSLGTLPTGLEKLELKGMGLTSKGLLELTLPAGLQTLEVLKAELTSIAFLNHLPPSLRSLILSHNPFTAIAGPLRFPPRLEVLEMDHNPGLGSMDGCDFQLPSSLVQLSLEGCGLALVEGLLLPPGLTKLNLSDNPIHSLKTVILPPALVDLNVRGTDIRTLTTPLPDKIESLDISKCNLKTLAGFHLPVKCTNLFLASNPLTHIRFNNANDPRLRLTTLELSHLQAATIQDIMPFPESLTTLSLQICQFSDLQGAKFPSRLKTLKLSRNRLVSLEGVVFPRGLETLQLSHNKITSLDGVEFPASLLELELEHNLILTIDGVRFPPGLVRLDFESNRILEVLAIELPQTLKLLSLLDQTAEAAAGDEVCTSERPLSVSEYPLRGRPRAGLQCVSGLRRLPRDMETLELCCNNLSEAAVAHLVFPAGMLHFHMHDNPLIDYALWERAMRHSHPHISIDTNAGELYLDFDTDSDSERYLEQSFGEGDLDRYNGDVDSY